MAAPPFGVFVLDLAKPSLRDSPPLRGCVIRLPADIIAHPTDIVLILDHSGSMAGSALGNLKDGAKAFIGIISDATGGARSGQIGSGSRIGIVSFAGTAAADTQLITSVSDLNGAVDALSADGNTNHADAFTKGTASLLDNTSVQWKIDELGVSRSEGAALEFTVRHIGPCSGTVEVNESVTCSSAEGNAVTFPSPELDVDCGIVPGQCPEAVDVAVDGCEDSVCFDAGDLRMESLGRVIQLGVRLRNVCPNRRVALAVLLSEVDRSGNEYKRGLRTMTVPAHTGEGCRDVVVRHVKFVLPEDLDVSGSPYDICNARNFKARFIAHYIDNDFDCCELML